MLCGLTYIEGYGLSETMAPSHINPPDRPKPQCLGLPIFDTDSRVIDPRASVRSTRRNGLGPTWPLTRSAQPKCLISGSVANSSRSALRGSSTTVLVYVEYHG